MTLTERQREDVKVGQIWREVDPRQERYIRVERVLTPHVIDIRCVTFDGTLWIPKKGTRLTQALATRFNGKRGGYDLYMEAP